MAKKIISKRGQPLPPPKQPTPPPTPAGQRIIINPDGSWTFPKEPSNDIVIDTTTHGVDVDITYIELTLDFMDLQSVNRPARHAQRCIIKRSVTYRNT
jgi:hypothetical protein